MGDYSRSRRRQRIKTVEALEQRIINNLPPPFFKEVTPYTQSDFTEHTKFMSMNHKHIIAHNDNHPRHMIRMVLIGDCSVGKTSIINKFCYGAFERSYAATMGVSFDVENFTVLDTPVKMEILDTAGQERFRSIACSYFRGADIILCVYDMSQPKSLRGAYDWINEVRPIAESANDGQILVFLVGNKLDLVENTSDYGKLSIRAKKIAADLNVEYCEISTRNGNGLIELFQRIAALGFDEFVQKYDDPTAPKDTSRGCQKRLQDYVVRLLTLKKNINSNESGTKCMCQ